MPESAEVKIASEFLNKHLCCQIIEKWVMSSGQYFTFTPSGYEEFVYNLPLIVETVFSKGKNIYFVCHTEYGNFYIIHNLRLTGSWSLEESPNVRWYIDTDSGKRLYYHDEKCFGTLFFTTDESSYSNSLNSLGPDIITEEFDLKTWKNLVSQNGYKNITSFLMDQSIMSGCGNYTKCEALYYAKLSPLRKVRSLTETENERLFEALRVIPRVIYAGKHCDEQGITGSGVLRHEFMVYRKSGGSIVTTKTTDGRTTYWDKDVQK